MENVLDALALYGYLNLEDRIEFELDGVIEKEIAPAYCNENFELYFMYGLYFVEGDGYGEIDCDFCF